jgi:hypothetical protein
MQDQTEPYRRTRQAQLNELAQQGHGELIEELSATYGQIWNTEALRQDFEVLGFMAPFVVVREKATGKTGSLEFCHSPRFYFNWQEDK